MEEGACGGEFLEAERDSFYCLQLKELDESLDELTHGTKTLKQILATVSNIKRNNYYLDSSPNVKRHVVKKIYSFAPKLASIRYAIARARCRYTFLSGSLLGYMLNDSFLEDTDKLLSEVDENLVQIREIVPELEKRLVGAFEEGDVEDL